jgi:hypothetical protein
VVRGHLRHARRRLAELVARLGLQTGAPRDDVARLDEADVAIGAGGIGMLGLAF